MRKTYQLTEEQHNLHRETTPKRRHPMTIQQTERAREILARLEEIDGNKAGAFTLRTEGAVGSVFEAKLAVVLEALTPQTSEEVVETVARAIERADNETGYEYDHLHIECSDWGIHLARAAIAAMPSIPQESDAEVTEEMLSAGRKYLLGFGIDDMDDSEVAGIYTAMTSARDREQPK